MRTLLHLLLVFSLVFTSCSSDSENITSTAENNDPSQDPTLTEFTFIFNINLTILNGPIRFIISDSAGTILGEAIADSNQQAQITVSALENMIFDLTTISEVVNQNGSTNYTVNITQDFKPGTYNINQHVFDEPASTSLQLNITNTGTPGIIRPSHGEDRFYGNYSQDNGGTIDFENYAFMKEGFGGFYMSFIRNGESEERYYWSENPPTSNPETINYLSLPVQENFITMSTPPDFTSSNVLEIQGYHPSNTSFFGNSIAVRENLGFLPPLTYGLPEGIFNRFRIENLHSRGDRAYWIIRTSFEPFTALPLSDLNMNVSNGNLNSFTAQIEGNGDVYRIHYEYKDLQVNTLYELTITGNPKPNIAFSKGTLLSSVLAGSISLSSLQLQYVEISDYEGINEYQSYITSSMNGSLRFPSESENFTSFFKYM